MKYARMVFLIVCILFLFSIPAKAETAELFESDIRQIEGAVDGDKAHGLAELGADSVDGVIADGVDFSALGAYLTRLVSASIHTPFMTLILLLSALLLVAVAESYIQSLRYTETRDVMSTAVSLFIAGTAIVPISSLARDAVSVIQGAAGVMLLYLPVMAGMLTFSGGVIASTGYYAAVVTGAQVISGLSSKVLLPLLNVFLSVSVSASVSGRLHLGGLLEMLTKGFKWLLTFSMSLFAAVIGLNGALSSAGGGLAGRAARFTLSSLIPLIGSSLSEAYSAIQGSIGILRSGVGVFVILSLFVSFMPLLVRILLWSMAVQLVKLCAEMLCVSSASGVLNALSAFLSALRATVVSVLAAFVIASSVMMRIGGAG